MLRAAADAVALGVVSRCFDDTDCVTSKPEFDPNGLSVINRSIVGLCPDRAEASKLKWSDRSSTTFRIAQVVDAENSRLRIGIFP